MTLQRKLIRQAVADLLKGATAAGTNVVPGRIPAPEEHDLPALSVFTMGESVRELNQAPRMLERELRLVVEVYVRTDATHPARVDDQLDDLCHQVEQALNEPITVLEDVPAELLEIDRADTLLDSIQLGLLERAARPVAGASMEYTVTYRTTEGVCGPEALAPFFTTHTAWDLAPPDGVLDATDTTELPQT